MSTLFQCPHGHSFEPNESRSVDTRDTVRCPVCAQDQLHTQLLDAELPEPPPLSLGMIRPLDRPVRPPTELPGYRLLGPLGRGGMGIVYKARQLALDRLVALKMLLHASHADESELARFRAEAETIARLQHPNIVQIYEIYEHDGCPVLSMELVEGGSLAQRVDNTPQDPHWAAALLATVARAVQHAHERGVIHRDLKPGNVLLTAAGEPKVSDFGLAKRLDQGNQTRTGMAVGTPNYMAPEQARGQRDALGPSADVYSLGAVLYEMLTGRPPFLGNDPLQTLRLAQTEEPVPPRRLQPRVPRDLETICLKCLQKAPGQRYPSAADFADDLDRLLRGEPIRARPAGPLERLLKWARRRPTAAALVGVSGLAGLLLHIVSLWFNVRLTAERSRAEANFRKAFEAVEVMLTEVAETQLVDEPRMEQKRRALLERALAFYEGFLAERGDDPAVRIETAQANQRLADINRQLGRYDRAITAYARAIELFEGLAARAPTQADLRERLGYCHNYLGEALRLLSRLEEAEKSYRRAEMIQHQLGVEFPDRPAYRLVLARSFYNLGIVAKDTNKPTDAEREFTAAIALLDELARRFPGVPDYRHELARAKLNLGPILRNTGRPTEAEAGYREAIRLLTQLKTENALNADYRFELGVCSLNLGNLLVTLDQWEPAGDTLKQAKGLFAALAIEFPSAPRYRKELANTANSLGAVYAGREQWTAAEDYWREAAGHFRRLDEEFPDSPEYLGGRAVALANLGWSALRGSDPEKARPLLKQAHDLFTAVLRVNPDHPTHRGGLASVTTNLIEVDVQLGEHAEAVRSVRLLPSLGKQSAADYALAAGWVARCVPLARRDQTLSAEQSSATARGYADEAIELLRQARALDSKSVAGLEANPTFAAIRTRTEFQRLTAP